MNSYPQQAPVPLVDLNLQIGAWSGSHISTAVNSMEREIHHLKVEIAKLDGGTFDTPPVGPDLVNVASVKRYAEFLLEEYRKHVELLEKAKLAKEERDTENLLERIIAITTPKELN